MFTQFEKLKLRLDEITGRSWEIDFVKYRGETRYKFQMEITRPYNENTDSFAANWKLKRCSSIV